MYQSGRPGVVDQTGRVGFIQLSWLPAVPVGGSRYNGLRCCNSMELRFESRVLQESIQRAAALFAERRMVVVFGDRLTLLSFSLMEPVRASLVGAATTESEGVDLVRRNRPDLLICSSDLETGYGINLLRQVKQAQPVCNLLIVLVRETAAVVQEAMEAGADGVIFKSSLGSGHGDMIGALQAVAEGDVYFPEEIRRLAVPATADPSLPELIEALTPRECDVAAAVACGFKNNAIAERLGISQETVKTHVGNAMQKLQARDRTQMAVKALRYGLINPLD